MIKHSIRVGNMMIAIAWLAILASSDLPNVMVARLFALSSVPARSEVWADIVKVALIGLLSVIVSFQPELRTIRGFLIALFAFSVGYLFVHLFTASQYWIHFRTSTLNYQWTMVNSLLKFVPMCFMLATAFSHGHTRKSLYLTKGDLS